jgi:hypothetical protein
MTFRSASLLAGCALLACGPDTITPPPLPPTSAFFRVHVPDSTRALLVDITPRTAELTAGDGVTIQVTTGGAGYRLIAREGGLPARFSLRVTAGTAPEVAVLQRVNRAGQYLAPQGVTLVPLP